MRLVLETGFYNWKNTNSGKMVRAVVLQFCGALACVSLPLISRLFISDTWTAGAGKSVMS
jgi:hypothetical protein